MKTSKIIKLISVIYAICSINSAYCQNHNSVSIKKDRDKTFVSVRIGNVTIPEILLDTGFSFDGIIIYNPLYRDSLDVSNAIRVNLGGAGDKNSQNALMIDSTNFFVGNKQLNKQRIIVLQSDIYEGFPSNGIIGYSLFGHYAVEIDYDKNVLILHDFDTVKPDSQFERVQIYFKDNMIPWVDVKIVIGGEEPVNISTYIDFADRDPVVLLKRPSMKFSLPEGSEKKVIGRGLSGDIYGSEGKISKLIIGPYQLDDVKVSIVPADVRSKQKNADAVVGCGALNRFNLIFDYRNKFLYLKPNKSFNELFNE